MQQRLFWLILLTFVGSLVQTHATTAPKKVLASLHPLALMAASVVDVEQIETLVPKGMTPHDFSLRPSDIDRIQNADLVLWAGPETEPYLKGFVKRWPEKNWLDISQFAHDTKITDPHWWLSPSIMIAAQQQLAATLELPAGDFSETINNYVAQAQAELKPLSEQGFWVFHQAYDHYVDLMGLNQLGAFTLSPEHKPGGRTLQKIRKQLSSGEVVCVFSEPEYSPALVETVLKGSTANRGELDPMALSIPLQKDGYLLYLQDMTQRFKACLTITES